MKKILVILLSGIMVFSLASCNTEETPNKESGIIQVEEVHNAEENNSDTTRSDDTDVKAKEVDENEPITVDSFLDFYGFDADDLKPNYFTSYEEIQMVDDKEPGKRDSNGNVTINVEKGKTTADDYNAWFEKLYEKMYELSADGKLYYTGGNAMEAPTLEELQAEAWWSKAPGSSCFLSVDAGGKSLRISVSYKYDVEAEQYKLSIGVLRVDS